MVKNTPWFIARHRDRCDMLPYKRQGRRPGKSMPDKVTIASGGVPKLPQKSAANFFSPEEETLAQTFRDSGCSEEEIREGVALHKAKERLELFTKQIHEKKRRELIQERREKNGLKKNAVQDVDALSPVPSLTQAWSNYSHNELQISNTSCLPSHVVAKPRHS